MSIQIGQSLAAGAIVDAERCTAWSVDHRVAHNACQGDLAAAMAEIRNDELLLTRQARELARQAALIGALEGALASASRHADVSAAELGSSIVERPPEALAMESAGPRPPRTIGEPSNQHLVLEKLEVFPTVYTNLGSLLDVFA